MSSDDSVSARNVGRGSVNPQGPRVNRRQHILQPSQQGSLLAELWTSSELLFQTKVAWLLSFGPLAILGDATNVFGEATCFAFSGIALIPCAERLSFVTEQVAEHTNGTVGALLNATFGNAPELLIATAALRSGFYRVVQLTMLGSMLTNLLFVFGVSCLIGGLRWQVQELRITSGNVSVGMLLVCTTASLLPAVLIESGQLVRTDNDISDDTALHPNRDGAPVQPSKAELHFSRINAFMLVSLYISYLVFQLGTHKEEFDDNENDDGASNKSTRQHHRDRRRRHRHGNRRNRFCLPLFRYLGDKDAQISTIAERRRRIIREANSGGDDYDYDGQIEMLSRREYFRRNKDRNSDRNVFGREDDPEYGGDEWSDDGSRIMESIHSDYSSAYEGESLLVNDAFATNGGIGEQASRFNEQRRRNPRRKHRRGKASSPSGSGRSNSQKLNGSLQTSRTGRDNSHDNVDGVSHRNSTNDDNDDDNDDGDSEHDGPLMSFRVGIIWLLVITLCVSALSDMLVDTIDGFAMRMKLSSVFTSMVIVPFFSNVAEQVSAILFAFRNEMDLCVGVTVGSAIQVAAFVLPGSVLIGMFVDRSMSLYFHAYETVCLFLGVVTVAAVLQGGTTNWMVGAMLVGIYTMMASGFWFHEEEDLAIDAEVVFQNSTAM